MLKRISYLATNVVVTFALALPPAEAQQRRITFVRDAEIENTIRAFATPLFGAAGLDPAATQVHLVNDPSLNAFVANGLNMFINTGLLARSENAGQVIGVIAHETGHIMGGHLARLREGLKGALAESIVALVLGAAAAVASGRPDAGAAVIAGGLQSAERGILRYNRELESSADQSAINLLDRTGQSAQGLAEFLDILADQELLTENRQDPYVRTHPISRERVEFVRNHVAQSRYSNVPPKREFVEMHARMRAKLHGYIDPPRALRLYPETNNALEARYARAMAYSRQPDYPRALAQMDSLIAERPNDAYFIETKGQILFEAGRPAEALPLYERAAQLLPDEALIRIGLAQTQLEFDDPKMTKAAIANLELARRHESDNGSLWRLLTIAYGRDGQLGMTALAQAERAFLQNRKAEARAHAERAERILPSGSPAWLRAQDIRQAAQRERN